MGVGMKLRPTGDRIVVQPLAAKKVSEGGLHIPENAQTKEAKGIVVAVGKGKIVDGKRVPPDVSERDTVLYGKYAGNQVQLGGEDFVILSETEILGVITEDETEGEG